MQCRALIMSIAARLVRTAGHMAVAIWTVRTMVQCKARFLTKRRGKMLPGLPRRQANFHQALGIAGDVDQTTLQSRSNAAYMECAAFSADGVEAVEETQLELCQLISLSNPIRGAKKKKQKKRCLDHVVTLTGGTYPQQL